LIFQDRPGLGGDQEFQFTRPGQTEIPTYLQSQPSTLVAQINENAFVVHGCFILSGPPGQGRRQRGHASALVSRQRKAHMAFCSQRTETIDFY
jgi:hypothetical protein